jgi:acetylornithine deacetylase
VDGGVILSGHMDVVPVEGQDWQTDPFVLTEGKEGNLYGRGACDMKGFLACCLNKVDFFQKLRLKKPIYFAFSYDEEIGCLGAPFLIEDIIKTYSEKPKYAIIGEPSLMHPIVGQKGICVIRTTVNGSAGHSSRIKQEVSAIHESVRLIKWIEEKMDKLLKDNRLDNRFSPPYSSLHVGKINSGIAPNVIADHCVFDWDIRVIPMDSMESILSEFTMYCQQLMEANRHIYPDFEIRTELLHPPVPPLDTKYNMDVVKLVTSLIEKQELGTVAYAAEAGQFAERGFESIICGPGSIEQAHRPNEFIAVSELIECNKFLENLGNHLAE